MQDFIYQEDVHTKKNHAMKNHVRRGISVEIKHFCGLHT